MLVFSFVFDKRLEFLTKKPPPDQPLLSATNSSHPNDANDPEAQNWMSYATIPRRASEHQDTQQEGNSGRTRVNPRIVSDAILGLSDGLTVPFALSAGLSGFGNTKVVVLGSLAELVAGAISMGIGGYVGAKSEV